MYLFKYFEPARVDVIKNRHIRFTQPRDFNDPFEFKPVISAILNQDEHEAIVDKNIEKQIEEELSKLPKEFASVLSQEKLEEHVRNFLIENQSTTALLLQTAARQCESIYNKKSSELIGVLCLTEEKDNLLMWSHYADSHKGFCIKFDASHDFFNRKRSEEDDFYHLRKVKYFKNRPSKILSNMSGVDLLLCKSDIWAYENEWRFCGLLNDSEHQIECDPLDIHLFELPKGVIQEVILGVNASKELEQEMRSIISKIPELFEVKLSKAKISDEHYSLEFTYL